MENDEDNKQNRLNYKKLWIELSQRPRHSNFIKINRHQYHTISRKEILITFSFSVELDRSSRFGQVGIKLPRSSWCISSWWI